MKIMKNDLLFTKNLHEHRKYYQSVKYTCLNTALWLFSVAV